MNMNFLFLYCALSFVNVVIQTVKSLCTVKCSTFISACVNAVAYGLYVYVIFFTNAEGLELWGKALITAVANFTGVYIANMLFNKVFTHEVEWIVNVIVPEGKNAILFQEDLEKEKIEYLKFGDKLWMAMNDKRVYYVSCPTCKDSEKLKKIIDKYDDIKYIINENIKRL